MTDIIERLREYGDFYGANLCIQAADEIEKLRGEVAALKAAAEKGTEYVLAQINQDLRAERDAAVKALERIKNHVDTDEYAYEIAVAAIDAAQGEK